MAGPRRWIDISMPVKDGMPVWPGDPAPLLERVADQSRGDPCTLTRVAMGAHTGTHMDAPLHFLRDTATLDRMPIEATVGPARVIAISDATAIRKSELVPHAIGPGERILFRTANSRFDWCGAPFREDYIYIAPDAAEYLAERGVRSVGIDYLSVGGFHEHSAETHEALLSKGVWIMEGLVLNAVEPGDYELICLPLRWIGTEGAPARAILRAAQGTE
jgi:arylformamidase